MLKALFSAPNRTLTATQLAAAAGYTSYASANEKFGKLARMVAEDLGFVPDQRPDGSPIWTLTLASADPNWREDDREWRWAMRQQVADCLIMMNLGLPGA
jgi:hypothetical protein